MTVHIGVPEYMKWLTDGEAELDFPACALERIKPPPILSAMPGDAPERASATRCRVVPFTRGQTAPTEELARLHRELLPTSPAVLLGQHFLESFYYAVLPREGYIHGALAYVDETPAGFLVYTLDSDGFMRRTAMHHAARLAGVLAADMLANPRLLKHLFESWTLMRSRTPSSEPIAEILSVGVQPFCRGREFKARTGFHVAESLHFLALDQLRRIGVKLVRTIVDEDNERSIQYHLKTGWRIFSTGIPGWKMPSIELRIRPEDFRVL